MSHPSCSIDSENKSIIYKSNDLIDSLLDIQPPAHSLQQAFYTSEAIYNVDINDVLMPHWHFAGHASQIPAEGDYLLFEFNKESMIIIRGRDNEIRGLANVCRHRGSRICSTPGRAEGGMLICPYHAWSYSLDGNLQHARMMPRDFDRESHSLKELPVRVVQGLIFVTFSDQPLGFDQVEESLTRALAPHGWENAKVAYQSSTTFKANWKLAIENQVECYHCAPSHPEFSVVHGQGTKDEAHLFASILERTAGMGIETFIRDQWALDALPGQELDYANRYPMRKGAMTASIDGKPIAPLMGKYTEYDGGQTLVYVGVLNHLLAYSDYGAVFRYTPKSATETELSVTWLVKGDAAEGKDYDLEALTKLWKVTAAADKRIVEENQMGVQSKFYRPGPYALPIEDKTNRLTSWYIDKLRSI